MRIAFGSICLISAGALLGGASAARGSVSLNFINTASSQSLASVSPGGTFNFSVMMTETAVTDQVSGVDYQIQASNNGVFQFLSRNSQVSGSQFTFANGLSDAQLTPTTLNPNNGSDLGTSTSSGGAVSGPHTYEISDFSFQVLPGTPTGAYTLSFVNTDTSGAPPRYAVGNFSSLGTYTVFVPGPPIVGDANFDGKVDGSDYSRIDNGYLNHLTGWSNGDFNLDGVIDGSDYTLIDNAFNTYIPPPTAQSAASTTEISSAVPEPASVGILTVGSLLTLKRRRSTHNRLHSVHGHSFDRTD